MSVDGNWSVTINTPMGAQNATLTLKTDGAELSGALDSSQGRAEIKEGKADGNSVSWKAEINGPAGQISLTFTGTVDGDAISGDVDLGAFGKATYSGTRA